MFIEQLNVMKSLLRKKGSKTEKNGVRVVVAFERICVIQSTTDGES